MLQRCEELKDDDDGGRKVGGRRKMELRWKEGGIRYEEDRG